MTKNYKEIENIHFKSARSITWATLKTEYLLFTRLALVCDIRNGVA